MAHPQMTLPIRLWLLLTRCLPFLFHLTARWAHHRMNAAPERFAERLGQATQTADGPVIWFHAASLGEVMQIRPLAQRLIQSEAKPILVTTATQAGADWVAREMPDAIHQFAPLDTAAAVDGFLNTWTLTAAIFIEGDLWPRLVLDVQKRGTPCILLNARNSRTRARLSSTFSVLLARFSLLTCRSEQIAADIRTLGVRPEVVKVLPDLRIATADLPCPDDLVAAISAQTGERPVWLAASTHPLDEEAVLAAHQHIMATHPDALLILAPRHPNRADPLSVQVRDRKMRIARRSKDETITPDTQIYLADTLGELGVFFSIAPITFLGGSFGDEGGHNPYEPAHFGSAILSGPMVKNFADAYASLIEAGAAGHVTEASALGPRVATLINTDAAQAMGAAGHAFMQSSEDSVAETIALIKAVLKT